MSRERDRKEFSACENAKKNIITRKKLFSLQKCKFENIFMLFMTSYWVLIFVRWWENTGTCMTQDIVNSQALRLWQLTIILNDFRKRAKLSLSHKKKK